MDLLWGILVIIGFIIILGFIGNSGRPYWREKTDREEALHETIQRATAWRPGFPPSDAKWNENNEWTDPNTGKTWKRVTLAECFKNIKKQLKDY